MVGVSRIVLPFAFASLALLSDLSEKPDNKPTIGRTTAFAAASETNNQKAERSAPTAPSIEPKIPSDKSPSVIQMLEGREEDLIVWASIAVVFFAIGWVWGGNYYLRRDRVRSRKLRF